jgi:hypothetical protein
VPRGSGGGVKWDPTNSPYPLEGHIQHPRWLENEPESDSKVSFSSDPGAHWCTLAAMVSWGRYQLSTPLVVTRPIYPPERRVSDMLRFVKAAKTALLGSKICYHPIKNVFPEKSFTSPAEYYLFIGGGNHKSWFFPMGGKFLAAKPVFCPFFVATREIRRPDALYHAQNVSSFSFSDIFR